MNRIKLLGKIFKYFFFFITLLIIIFFIVLYFSKQNLYTESDFNIPKGYFDTKYQDKDPNSEDNGFEKLLKIYKAFSRKNSFYDSVEGAYIGENILTSDIANKYTCFIENDNSICEDDKEKFILNKKNILYSGEEINKYNEDYYIKIYNEMLTMSYNSLKKILNENNIFNELYNKKFIKRTSDYGSDLSFSNYQGILNFIKSSNYLAIIEFDNGNYELGVDILLENQKFIDFVINNSDMDKMDFHVYFTLYEVNISTINYLLDNYSINKKYLIRIYDYFLNNNIEKGIIKNVLKQEMFNIYKNLEFSIDLDTTKSWYESYLEFFLDYLGIKLFFSKEETILLLNKYYYDNIENNGIYEYSFKQEYLSFNLGNYYGRSGVLRNSYDYKSQLEKEGKFHERRANLIKFIEEKIEILETQELTSSKSIKSNENSVVDNINILQNDEKTYVEYKGAIIYEEKNDLDSFSPGYACDHFNYCISNGDVKPDIDLDEIQRELIKKIEIKHLYGDIFLINRYYYEGGKSILFNTNTLEKKEIGLLYYKEIYKNDEKIVLEQNTYGGIFILEINNNLEINNIFSPKDGPNVFTEFISYELLGDILKIEYYKSNSSGIKEKMSYFYYLDGYYKPLSDIYNNNKGIKFNTFFSLYDEFDVSIYEGYNFIKFIDNKTKSEFGTNIFIYNISDFSDLDKFIKNKYGFDCGASDKIIINNKDYFTIDITVSTKKLYEEFPDYKDGDGPNPFCNVNPTYQKIFYSEKYNKLVIVEGLFDSIFRDYLKEFLDSFEIKN